MDKVAGTVQKPGEALSCSAYWQTAAFYNIYA